jgi:hypothetical protein
MNTEKSIAKFEATLPDELILDLSADRNQAVIWDNNGMVACINRHGRHVSGWRTACPATIVRRFCHTVWHLSVFGGLAE